MGKIYGYVRISTKKQNMDRQIRNIQKEYPETVIIKEVYTGTNVDYILEGVNKYLLSLAKEQIRLAFLQSQKEVMDLRQRTKEGMETARMNNKQIGLVPGTKLITKKSIECKKQIQKYSRDFDGMLSDKECIQLIGIARGTYYKYKREIKDGVC